MNELNQIWVKSFHTAISEIWTCNTEQEALAVKAVLEAFEDGSTDEVDAFEDMEYINNLVINSIEINSNLYEQDNYNIINPDCFVYYY